MVVALVLALLLSIIKLVSLAGSRAGIMLSFIVSILDWVRGLGAWGVPVLFLCESIFFLMLIPISLLHVGVGFLYGFTAGCPVAWTAYAIGWYEAGGIPATARRAVAAPAPPLSLPAAHPRDPALDSRRASVPPFLCARIPCLAERIRALRRKADLLDGVFSAVEQEPFKLIVCLRLSPMLPSPLNSYLLGLTAVPLRTYLAASLVGAGPNTAAYVYLGTLLDSLADIAAGRMQRSPMSWALLLIGLVATLGMLLYVSRVATRRVQQASRARMMSAEEQDDRLESGKL